MNLQKKFLLALVVILSLAACKQAAHVSESTFNPLAPTPTLSVEDALVSKLDARLAQYTQLGEFSGSVLFASDENILLEKGYGLADRANDIPNTQQTKFYIASLTKQFTAMSILILQEQRKLNVQDLFCSYYPDCPDAWQGITIHQLLTHTSGILTFTQIPAYADWGTSPKTPEEIIAFFRDEPMMFQPGESWAYSNSGYILLGWLIEDLSGLSYEEFLQNYIFAPLQMNDSGYDPDIVEGVAVGYYDKTSEPAFQGSPSVGFSCGGIYSTVEDLYLWDQALYTDQLIPQTALDAMFSPYAAAFDSSIPNYGYGWIIEEQAGHRVVYHQGATDGFKAYIMRFPDVRITIILLSNQMDVTAGVFSKEFASEILHTLAK
jgi:CubicO group peptidase (beta-lactamase class C family)